MEMKQLRLNYDVRTIVCEVQTLITKIHNSCQSGKVSPIHREWIRQQAEKCLARLGK